MPEENKTLGIRPGYVDLCVLALSAQVRPSTALSQPGFLAGTSDRLWKAVPDKRLLIASAEYLPGGSDRNFLISLIGLNALQPRLTCKE
jgi:hypothetical protein